LSSMRGMRALRASPLRPLAALILTLGLLPGLAGGLGSAGEMRAHCNHACCRGVNFCAHESHDTHATHEHPDPQNAELAIRVLRAGDHCPETCGVLCQVSQKNATGRESTAISTASSTRFDRPATSRSLRALANVREASPRAPPV
jgi:hypothetical protein